MNARLIAGDWEIRQEGFDGSLSTDVSKMFTLSAGRLTLPGNPEEDMDAPPPADACDALFTRLCVNGHHVKPRQDAQDYSYALDLRTAGLSREYTASLPEGFSVRVRFERALSLKHPGCAAQRVTVTSERDALLSLVLGADGSALSPAWKQAGGESRGNAASLSLLGPEDEQTFLFCVDAPSLPMAMAIDRRSVLCVADGLRAGSPCTVERRMLCAAAPCGLDALDGAPGLDAILRENEGVLALFWERAGGLPPGSGLARLSLLRQFLLDGIQ